MQVTGKGNYKQNEQQIVEYFADPVDSVTNPDLVASTDYAMKSALSYWASRGIGSVLEGAQKEGKSVEKINQKVTRLVNGGKNGLQERLAETRRILAMSFFALCEKVEKGAKQVATRVATFVQLAWNAPRTNQRIAERLPGDNI